MAFVALLAMAIAAEEKPKQHVLLDGNPESLDNWEEVDMGGSGPVSWYEDRMVVELGEMLSGAVYKKADQLPTTNYEITLEAMRTSGVDFFCGLTFPVGDLETCATFIMGGWGGSVTGISSIDGMDAANNATGTFQRYEDDKWYQVKLRVTPKNLSAWIGDEQVVDIDIEGRKVSLRAGPMEAYAPLSLTTYNTTGEFRNVVLTELASE
jgi:hypothetical protein